MKKLIAISVVFALVAGAVFAVDVSGTVIGTMNVIESTTAKNDKVRATGGMDRIRLDGAGENDDGTFGGYIRAQVADGAFKPDAAYAWWKPVDQFKLILGCQSDGFWGKEGVTGWGFNQVAQDTGVAVNYGIWFGWWDWKAGGDAYSAWGDYYLYNRYTFFEGWNGWGAGVEITPADMVSINLAIPYIDFNGYEYPGDTGDSAGKSQAKNIYRAAIAQVDFHFDFGNIALTYDGSGRAAAYNGAQHHNIDSNGAIFLYAGLNVIDNLGIDVGFSYHLKDEKIADYNHPIGIGVGAKYTTDSFGIKFRTTVALAGEEFGDDGCVYINSTLLPFFNVSDNLTIFVQAGAGVILPPEGDSVFGWIFNPYLRVGAEYGPSFYAGVKVSSNGDKDADDKTTINWAVPISLVVSF